ncbi:GNAT family N-acetyltransferase [Acinetobacter soli]|uniref:GNAT family N-acetyltransferase n=1 Tax=Acinetobacter soli TaxID=487316 RepID=UPI00125067B7|nr:GNAT family protein [Acinetobacter soli]MDS7694921.1 GNAT family N-acetyltransferase [Acinetobacter soli]
MKSNQFGQPVGDAVALAVPIQLKAHTLTGNYVDLLPIEKDTFTLDYAKQLWTCVNSEPDARCWTYLPYEAPQSEVELEQNLRRKFGFEPSHHYWIVVEGKAVGWVALLNLRAQHAAVEIGNVYFSHRLKQTPAATEAIFLLLRDCFKQGMRRVEWKCDDLNQPSKNAALRFGFTYEGLFRQDRVTKGRNRDTAWFSMIDIEWPKLQNTYLQWLDPLNFDKLGKQKRRLEECASQEI